MSRYYSVRVECVGKITEQKLRNVMENKLGWSEDADTWVRETSITFSGKGNLYGGEGEEEAHARIVKLIKEIDPQMKIQTTWTYLEDLPTNTYGDDLD